MIGKLRAGIAKLAARGAVIRRGGGALQAYGGTVSGEGYVIRKHDDPDGRWKAGDREDFILEGQPGSRPKDNGVTA